MRGQHPLVEAGAVFVFSTKTLPANGSNIPDTASTWQVEGMGHAARLGTVASTWRQTATNSHSHSLVVGAPRQQGKGLDTPGEVLIFHLSG